MLILGAMFFIIAMILIVYYRFIRRRRRYYTWDDVFDGVAQRMRERGYDIKETGEKTWVVSKKKES